LSILDSELITEWPL